MTPDTDHARLATWLDLAARGWAVFPVHPGRKQPAIRGWEQRATTDPERIAWFFTTHPDHNAGIACGPSGLYVIDCDTPKTTTTTTTTTTDARDGWAVLRELADTRGGLPRTWTVTTPSGGRHLYFRAPTGTTVGANTSKALGPMLDTRGQGGQVLAPGSRLPNGTYRLIDDADPVALPGWVVHRLTQRPPAPKSGPPMTASATPRHGGAYVSAILRAELQRVTEAHRGGHNAAVFTAARALGQLVGAGVLDHQAATADLTDAAAHIVAGPCDCTARDIAATIGSGLAYGARRPRRLPTPVEQPARVEGRRSA